MAPPQPIVESYVNPEDRLITQMIIPVSQETYFNTKWKPKSEPLCPYDMIYHPPDYDQKSARSDRRDPQITRRNIFTQEYHKPISSTNHFMYGRPYWKILDKPTKEFVNVQEPPVRRMYRKQKDLECTEYLLWSKALCKADACAAVCHHGSKVCSHMDNKQLRKLCLELCSHYI